MHCAMYDLSADAAAKYLEKPIKTVVYQDFISYRPTSLSAVAKGQPGRATITPGLARLRGLLIVPYISSAPTTSTTLNALTSPFTSCGMTTARGGVAAGAFNVAIGSRNIFDRNIRYTYDFYLREQYGIGAANGNGLAGLRTGLISEYDWYNGYQYIWVNLERHAASSDKLPTSVDVELVNETELTVGYCCYLFYEKEFSCDVITGKVIV